MEVGQGVHESSTDDDDDGDDESFELVKILKEHSAQDATAKVTGLDKDHPLFAKVQAIVEKVQSK